MKGKGERPTADETIEDLAWLADLERCDGFNPCGNCNRCRPGARPWQEARAEWLDDIRGIIR